MNLLHSFKKVIHPKTFIVSFILSLVWILGSDFIVHNLIPEQYNTELLQNIKGIAYILILSLILSWLHKRELKSNALFLAQRKQSLLGDFSGMIVHEVRNPLQSIHLCIQKVEDALDSSSPDTKYVQIANDSIIRLGETIEFLQNLSRGGSLHHFDKNQEIDLKSRIERTFELVKKTYFSMDVKLDVSDIELLVVKGNDSLLSHVFLNLVKNAMDYMKSRDIADAEISVVNLSRNDQVVIGIRNSGPPIPKEIQSKIFDHFTSKDVGEGTGFGLIFCRHIMTAHGGAIEYVEDTLSPMFKLYFPKESKIL